MKNQRCLALDGPMLERFTRHEPHDLVRRAANRLQHGNASGFIRAPSACACMDQGCLEQGCRPALPP